MKLYNYTHTDIEIGHWQLGQGKWQKLIATNTDMLVNT